MSKTHLIIPDAHAHPDHHNKRALWAGRLIADVKPDVVIDIGDSADMPSLASYDKGKRNFHGRSYTKDIEAYLDFQEKLWDAPRKSKRKMPHRIRLIGNHEQRIDRALDQSPELEGAIGYKDLDLERYYDTIVPYEGGTPGVVEIDGVDYAHYFVSGVMGKPIGGLHPGYALNQARHVSSTSGHAHTFSHDVRTVGGGRRKLSGLVCGVFQDYVCSWAGEAQKFWYPCVVIKTNVEDGEYDLQVISLRSLEKMYGTPND